MPRGDRSGGTREALLRSAAKVFTLRGPYGATVREIAEDAGLTVPAIYYHFDGTEHLWDTLVRESREHFRAMAEEALSEPCEPRARLAGFARACLRFGAEDPTRLRLLCMDLFGPQERVADRSGAELRGWVQERLTRLLVEIAPGGGDAEWPPLASRLFVALMNGLLVEQARDPGTAVLDPDLAERAVALFLSGIGGENGCGLARKAVRS